MTWTNPANGLYLFLYDTRGTLITFHAERASYQVVGEEFRLTADFEA